MTKTPRGDLDLDHDLADYLEARSTSRAPASLLVDALARVETTRQRTRWRLPKHWLRVPIANELGPTTRALVILMLAMVAALAITVAVVIGSRHRLPPPFGLARPGRIALDVAHHIDVANPDGTGQMALTSGPDTDFRATWSPDGTLIAYESQLAFDGSTSLIVMDADGGHRVTLADHLASARDISWSPDSRRVAISAVTEGGADEHVYVAAVGHPGATELGGPDLLGQDPSWSPDGSQIAFKRIFPCCATRYGLWLMAADGSDLRPLSTATGNRDNAFWNIAWSPDGKRLAFLADGVGGSMDVYVIDAAGTVQKDLTSSPEDEFWPTWSPDGSRIAFPRMWPRMNNQGSFLVADPDGSQPITLSGSYVNSNAPVWSPDGMRLLGYVYDPSSATNTAVAVFDPSGRAPPTLMPINDYNSASWQRLAP